MGLMLSALAVSAVLVMACGGTTSVSTGTTGSSASSGNTSTSTSAAAKPAGIGSTLRDSDGMTVTLVSAKPLLPSQYDQVKAGDEYLVLHVKIVNHGTSSNDYNDFDFKIQSKSGNQTNTTFSSAYTASAEVNSGSLTPNGSMEGDLVYEVATADHGASLVWSPGFGGTDYVWTFKY